MEELVYMRSKYNVYRLYNYRKSTRVEGFKYTTNMEYACESSLLTYSKKLSGFKSIPAGVTFCHKETPLFTVLKSECLLLEERVAVQNPTFTIEFRMPE